WMSVASAQRTYGTTTSIVPAVPSTVTTDPSRRAVVAVGTASTPVFRLFETLVESLKHHSTPLDDTGRDE
ncbi:MAG: hypothetical protein KDB69_00275, partial [Acidimicrobiia bacterium]|nr:hypothetical protein [Acidimicrobiia bacterium]